MSAYETYHSLIDATDPRAKPLIETDPGRLHYPPASEEALILLREILAELRRIRQEICR